MTEKKFLRQSVQKFFHTLLFKIALSKNLSSLANLSEKSNLILYLSTGMLILIIENINKKAEECWANGILVIPKWGGINFLISHCILPHLNLGGKGYDSTPTISERGAGTRNTMKS